MQAFQQCVCWYHFPGALQKLQKRGVRIFVAPLLHSNKFAFDAVGFVGSTNASKRSQIYLSEAVYG